MKRCDSGQPNQGEGAHIWLTWLEQEKLLAAVDVATVKGQRDNVLLRLLLGAGLRRTETAELQFDNIKMMGDTPVLEILGKGKNNALFQSDNAWQNFLMAGV